MSKPWIPSIAGYWKRANVAERSLSVAVLLHILAVAGFVLWRLFS